MSTTILVVDDDETLGQILCRVLERRGYSVCRAQTASEAVRVAQECRPSLALLDLCLPDGNGLRLGSDLRRQMPGLALLLMTAYPLRLREHPAGAEIFAQLLRKPLNLKELHAAIEAGLANAPAPTRAEVAADESGAAPASTSKSFG
jgi:DNA-binding response OmpR family regulator